MKFKKMICAAMLMTCSLTGFAHARPSFKQRHPIVHFIAKSAVKATVVGVGVAGGEYLYHKMTDDEHTEQPQQEYVPPPSEDHYEYSHESSHDSSDDDDSYHNDHRQAFRHGW